MAGSWGDLFALIKRIKLEYPELAYLLDNNEVGPLLLKAVGGGMDTNEFTFKLHNTNWWKKTSEPARKWDAFANIDPATAKAQIKQMRESLHDQARTMGVDLTLKGRHWIAVSALRFGWSEADITRAIAKQATWDKGDLPGGDLGATFDQYRTMSRDFGVKLRGEQIFNRARATVAGGQSMEGFQAEMRHRAMERFAGNEAVLNGLKNGASLREIFSPIQNEVAAQLELPPEAVDVVNGERWQELLSYRDPESGNIRVASIPEAVKWARSTNQFRSTDRARKEASELAEGLLQEFGAVAA